MSDSGYSPTTLLPDFKLPDWLKEALGGVGIPTLGEDVWIMLSPNRRVSISRGENLIHARQTPWICFTVWNPNDRSAPQIARRYYEVIDDAVSFSSPVYTEYWLEANDENGLF